MLLCASPREQALNAPNATLTQLTLDRCMEQYPDNSHLDMAYLDTAGIYTEQLSNIDALHGCQ